MAFSFFKGSRNQETAPEVTPAEPEGEHVEEIPVSMIVPNRNQPRKVFSKESIDELAETIREHGLLQPVILRKCSEGEYEIIAGERRFRAVSSLGWESIPAIVKDMSDRESASFAIIENLQREGLTAIEEASAYSRLMEINHLTQQELAREIGKSQSFVANKLRLLKLCDRVKEAIMNKSITERHGRAMSGLEEGQQIYVLDRIAESHLSVKETEDLVRKLRERDGRGPEARPVRKGVVRDVRIAVNTVRDAVNMVQKHGVDVRMHEEDGSGFHRIIIDIPNGKSKGD